MTNLPWKRLPRFLAHAAAFVLMVLCIGDIGSKDHIRLKACLGRPVSAAGLPFMLTLRSFDIETYEGTSDPMQYVSDLTVTDASGSTRTLVISVNHPAAIYPWSFYQVGYDVTMGADSGYSIIECVRDPLYPLIRIALWALMISSLLLVVKAVPRGRYKWMWITVGVLSAFFVWLTMDKVGVGARNLQPVLRSPWFVPHIVVYMFAYALLTALTVVALWQWIRSQRHAVTPDKMVLCDTLARLGWALLNAGMCMGALWAKEAWGDWWSWDPKETWALLTWTGYMAWFHLRGRVIRDPRTAFALLIFNFLLLQMCWWGVNFLPGASLHAY